MSLHETVLDGGHVIIRSRFKPGDEAFDEDGSPVRIIGVWVDDGRANYDYSLVDEDGYFDCEKVSKADRLWTLEGGKS